jgi:hypothetical protein
MRPGKVSPTRQQIALALLGAPLGVAAVFGDYRQAFGKQRARRILCGRPGEQGAQAPMDDEVWIAPDR